MKAIFKYLTLENADGKRAGIGQEEDWKTYMCMRTVFQNHKSVRKCSVNVVGVYMYMHVSTNHHGIDVVRSRSPPHKQSSIPHGRF